MRRCDRNQDFQRDPYTEFSFEKSLRKYGGDSRKKVKRTTDLQSITPLRDSLNLALTPLTSLTPTPLRETQSHLTQAPTPIFQLLSCQSSQQEENERDRALQQDVESHLGENRMGSDQPEGFSLQSQDKARPLEELLPLLPSSNAAHQASKQSDSPNTLLIEEAPRDLVSLEEDGGGEGEEMEVSAGGGGERGRDLPRGCQESRLTLIGGVSVSLRKVLQYRSQGLTESQILAAIVSKHHYLRQQQRQIAVQLRRFFDLNS